MTGLFDDYLVMQAVIAILVACLGGLGYLLKRQIDRGDRIRAETAAASDKARSEASQKQELLEEKVNLLLESQTFSARMDLVQQHDRYALEGWMPDLAKRSWEDLFANYETMIEMLGKTNGLLVGYEKDIVKLPTTPPKPKKGEVCG